METNGFDPDKKYFPSRSGKKGYIRVCQRCGKVLYRVGRTTKWCLECRSKILSERAQAQYRKTHGGGKE